jgi:phosphatidylglycerophosphatase A
MTSGASNTSLSSPPLPRAGRPAILIASLCGVGRFPFASGTAGSAAALLLWWGALRAAGDWGVLGLGLLLAVVGVWASGRVAASLRIEDPSSVVVDEAAGMLLTLAFIPPSWPLVAGGFLLFRALDVLKPWPASAAERLPGGLGIVTDDLVAALYANLLLRLAALVISA